MFIITGCAIAQAYPTAAIQLTGVLNGQKPPLLLLFE